MRTCVCITLYQDNPHIHVFYICKFINTISDHHFVQILSNFIISVSKHTALIVYIFTVNKTFFGFYDFLVARLKKINLHSTRLWLVLYKLVSKCSQLVVLTRKITSSEAVEPN